MDALIEKIILRVLFRNRTRQLLQQIQQQLETDDTVYEPAALEIEIAASEFEVASN